MRTVVITGVTSGIGAAITRGLRQSKDRVIGLGRNPESLARAEAEWGIETVCADLSDRDMVSAAIEDIRSRAPSIDVVICNAAEVVYEMPTEMSGDRWRRLFEVNLLSAIDLVNGLLPSLTEDGQLAWISSVVSKGAPNPKFTPYAMTKHALDDYFESVRRQLSRTGRRAIRIAPGLVDTPIYQKVDGFERVEAAIRKALPEWLTADDVADAALWALNRPPRVCIADIVLVPRGQEL